MGEPLKVTTSDYGDEYWYGGNDGQTVEVGEKPTRWLAGCGKDEPETWARLNREAAIISHALAPCDTVERQMALAVLAGDGAAALALADRLTEMRRTGEDPWGELLVAANIALEAMYHGDFKNGVTSPMGDVDEGDVMAGAIMDRLQGCIKKVGWK